MDERYEYLIDNVSGRFCNQLYVLLQAFIHNYLVIPSKTCYELDYITKFIDIGLKDLITEKCKENIPVHNSSIYPMINYGEDFTQAQLDNFCKLILNSKKYKHVNINGINFEKNLGVHIRQGDYKNNHYVYFDRKQYFKKCLDSLKKKNEITFEKVVIFSDDINISQKEFDSTFKNYFGDVQYISSVDLLDDLILLSKFKNKILLNTTFSAWSGFIGDSLYGYSHTVYIPEFLDMNDKFLNKRARYCNPSWNITIV